MILQFGNEAETFKPQGGGMGLHRSVLEKMGM
jgi:hypothetical protein